MNNHNADTICRADMRQTDVKKNKKIETSKSTTLRNFKR